jgi:hypothetical protein
MRDFGILSRYVAIADSLTRSGWRRMRRSGAEESMRKTRHFIGVGGAEKGGRREMLWVSIKLSTEAMVSSWVLGMVVWVEEEATVDNWWKRRWGSKFFGTMECQPVIGIFDAVLKSFRCITRNRNYQGRLVDVIETVHM